MDTYISSMTKGNHKITERMRIIFRDKVIATIADYFFGEDDDHLNNHKLDDPRLTKIKQNIEQISIGLLGMQVHRDDFETLIQMNAQKFIEACVSRGSAIGVETGQSLIQPIIQATLKSQHKTGNKQQISGANSIEHLNKLKTKTNVVRIHLLNGGRTGIDDDGVVIDHRYLADRYEEIKMHDILVSSIGNSKVRIYAFHPSIYDKTEVTFLNVEPHKNHRLKQVVYSFSIDPDKLSDAGITWMDVYATLVGFKGVGFVLYPMSMMKFDMIKLNNDDGTDLQIIAKLENTSIKGIKGLGHINTRTLNPRDVMKMIKINLDGDAITRILLDSYYYTQFPLRELKKRIVSKSSWLQRERITDALKKARKFEEDYQEKSSSIEVAVDAEIGSQEDVLSAVQYRAMRDKKAAIRKRLTSTDEMKALITRKEFNDLLIKKLNEDLKGHEYEVVKPLRENLRLSDTSSLLHIDYPGEVEISHREYTYYYFHGEIKIADITKHLDQYIDHDYTTINEPLEMIQQVGKSAAITNHEMLYSEELEATNTEMLYQHVSLICAYMFGYQLNPITPSGYLKNKGVTALERFAFEQYPENLGNEALKGTISNTKSMTTSIFTGNKADIGTAYIKFKINRERLKLVREEYKKAYEEQLYEGAYEGIELPVFDEIKMRSELRSGKNQLVNNINPFNVLPAD